MANLVAAQEEEFCCIDYEQQQFCEPYVSPADAGTCTGTLETKACEELPTVCNVGCCVLPGGIVETRALFSCEQAGGVIRATTEQPYFPGQEDIGCEETLRCTQDSECGAGLFCNTGLPMPRCDVRTAASSTCGNGLNDGDETDVDCGGSCQPCEAAKACDDNLDCASSFCDPVDGVCKDVLETMCGDGFISTSIGEQCEPGRAGEPARFMAGITACPDMTLEQTLAQMACTAECNIAEPRCPAPVEEAPEPEQTLPTGVCGDGSLDTPNSNGVNEQCEASNSSLRCSAFGNMMRWCQPSCACIDVISTIKPSDFSLQREQNAIRGSWAEEDTAPGVIMPQRFIYRCGREDGECETINEFDVYDAIPMSYDSTTERSFLDSDVEEGKEYCYMVGIKFSSGSMVLSDMMCIPAPSDVCSMGGVGERTCNPEKTATQECTSDYLLEEQPCQTGEVCIEAEPGHAACVDQQACEVCNGLFGMFGGILPVPASQMIGELACSKVLSCAYDTSASNVDKYDQCTDIKNCYDYHTKETCTQLDSCAIGPCLWHGAYGDLGIGVCRPQDEEKQDCSRCNADAASRESEFNNAFLGVCTKELCEEAYGACFLNDGLCMAKKEVVCEDYLTRRDCTDSTRSGSVFALDSNNAAINWSDDRFDYGVCTWTGTLCIKDYDADTIADCAPDDRPCQSDKQPPTTILVPVDEQVKSDWILVGRDLDIEVSVSEPSTTYFCINEGCTPTKEAMCKLQDALSGNGETVIRFFSKDANDNLEEIKAVPLFVDVDPPNMKISSSFDAGQRKLRVTLINDDYVEAVKCNAKLLDSDLRPVSQLPGSSASSDIVNEVKKTITRNYYQIEDDVYVVDYSCTDPAGNTKQGAETIVVNTNSVRIPIPSITADAQKQVTITTTSPAECRYSKTTASFEGMVDLKTGSTTPTTTHTITLPLTPGRNVYDVRCKFSDGDIQGNNGDRIIVSRDIYPPRVSFVQAYDKRTVFDPSVVHSGEQRFFIKCEDNDVPSGSGSSIVTNAGCKQTTLIIDGTAIPLPPHDSGRLLGPIVIPAAGDSVARHEISFTTADMIGVESTTATGDFGLMIDDTAPILTTRILSAAQEDVTDASRLQPGSYYVEVSSNNILTKAEVKLSLTERSTADETGATDREPVVKGLALDAARSSSLKKVFVLDLNIVTALRKGIVYQLDLDVTATGRKPVPKCFEEDIRVEDITLTDAKRTTVDAVLAEITLEPMLENKKTGPPGIDYGVSFDAGEYFTNKPSLFVTGRMIDPASTERILFTRTATGSSWTGTYTMDNNAEGLATEEQTTTTVGSAEAAAEEFRVANPERLSIFSFIRFKTHERASYGRYKDLYKVSEVHGDEIMLAEPLEKAVPGNTKVEIYTKPHPHDWFGIDVPLQEGRNDLGVVATSTNGINSIPKTAIIQRDTSPPQVVRRYPDFSITSGDVTKVELIVKEASTGSGIDRIAAAAPKISLNGAAKPTTLEDIPSEEEGFNYYRIFTETTSPLAEGTYRVIVTAQDKARNQLQPEEMASFTFKIDRSAALPPAWTVIDGSQASGIWYTPKEYQDILLDFSDNELPIVITGMIAKTIPFAGGSAVQFPVGRVCEEGQYADGTWTAASTGASLGGSTNIFKCRLTTPLANNNMYVIGVRAHKVLTTGQLPDVTFGSPPIVVDTASPLVSSLTFSPSARLETPHQFYAVIPNERFSLGARLTYSVDGKTYELVPSGNDLNGNYIFEWNVPFFDITQERYATIHEENAFQMEIYDYAGHIWESRRMIKIDAVPPAAADISFTVHATYALPGTNEYYTNQEEVRITGQTTGDDITDVYLEPGSYNPASKKYDARAYPARLPGNKFDITLKLKGKASDSIPNRFFLVAKDAAGNAVTIPLTIWYDQTVPDRPQIIIQ